MNHYLSKISRLNYLLIVVFSFNASGCNEVSNYAGEKMDIKISEQTKQSLDVIKSSRILFSHQSVGYNILSGLNMLTDEAKVELNVKNIDNGVVENKNAFAHTTGGKNEFPKTKIDSFVKNISDLKTTFVPDIAFMKLCYIDIKPDTDVVDVFNYYKNNIKNLQRENPRTTFIHLTVPLVAESNSLKSKIKRILGMQTWQEASNIKRHEYNNLLAETFKNEPIFDVARIESTDMNGVQEKFSKNGKVYYNLLPQYTSDGGHLNQLGQYVLATEMVNFLGQTLKHKITN